MTWQSPHATLTLGLADINEFIKQCDAKFSGQLSGFYNYPRVVALAHFAVLVNQGDLARQAHTGVISGAPDELELRFLQSEKTTGLSFENGYNLDQSWLNDPPQKFSLTLCNQVLEHVFNPHLAFRNLIHHTAVGGHLYVTIPTINCIHGEPDFYSSGYHPRFLERLALENELEIVSIGCWGSYKYMINAVSGYWLAEKQLVIGAKDGGLNPLLSNVDGRIKDDQFITDCWGLFKRV